MPRSVSQTQYCPPGSRPPASIPPDRAVMVANVGAPGRGAGLTGRSMTGLSVIACLLPADGCCASILEPLSRAGHRAAPLISEAHSSRDPVLHLAVFLAFHCPAPGHRV